MTLTETAKHLAKPSSGATKESPDHLDLVIQRVHQTYGYRKLHEELKRRGHRVNEKKILRIQA